MTFEKNANKVIRIIVFFIVSCVGLYAVLPIVIMGEDYILPTHDNLDHIAGIVEYIHNNGMFFSLNEEFPLMGGIPGYYFLAYISYGLSGILGAVFGYFKAQVIIRITGVILGFVSMNFLLREMFPKASCGQKNVFFLISILYAVTPSSLTRILSFAILPMIVASYIFLMKKKKFVYSSLFVVLFPFFSYFNAITLFAIIFWGLITLIMTIKEREVNFNLVVSFFSYIVGTLIFDFPLFLLIFHGKETTRSLHYPSQSIRIEDIKNTFLFGQYHAFSYHYYIIMICVVIGIGFYISRFFFDRTQTKKYGAKLLFLVICIIIWSISVLLEAMNLVGYNTGVQLIDGFQWGRIVGWGRLLWMIMLAKIFVDITNTDAISNDRNKSKLFLIKQLFWGFVICGILITILYRLFRDCGFPDSFSTYLGNLNVIILNVFRWIAVIAFAVGLFCEVREIRFASIVLILLVHGCYILSSNDFFTDNTRTVVCRAEKIEDDQSISYREFFSENLFIEIKKHISYDGEGVAAYGFFPSVLMYNGFNTVDGYLSVHPMKNHLEFREVIAPALDINEEKREYYDYWGGRMYLFGDLSYYPTREKSVPETDLLIDTEAYKRMGGKYIFSRGLIGNAEAIKLELIGDFTQEDSIYHIYVYKCYEDK